MPSRDGSERSTAFRDTLGKLADPTAFTGPIDLAQVTNDWALTKLHDILLIRVAEEFVADLVVSGEARCPCHLGIGQEAVAVGVSASLRSSDRVFGAHRSHSHYLALGAGLLELFAEVLGKEEGASKGMGGSMHLYAPQVGFHGSVPIVGATIPIATGAALACKMDGKGDVAVSYLGDGAAEEGVFHESLNLASTMGLPVLYVCENNLFASHLDIHLRQPENRVARFAEAHDVPVKVVDGNDVVEVFRAAQELIAAARNGQGPGYLEAVTYRWRGHVGPDENIDVGLRRSPTELAAWKQRDPARRLKDALIQRGALTDEEFEAMTRKLRAECFEAVEKARKAAYPPVSNLIDFVYRKHI